MGTIQRCLERYMKCSNFPYQYNTLEEVTHDVILLHIKNTSLGSGKLLPIAAGTQFNIKKRI